jgi:phage baseplate assembly protein W
MATAAYLDHPYQTDARGRSAEADVDGHVRDLIFQVLFTSPGERVNRPDFGCGLKQLLFMPNSDALATATKQLVQGSLHRWLDPIIAIDNVEVAAEDSRLTVTVAYRRRGDGTRGEARFERALP